MGQRANYVIKQGDQLTIHYHHWRATQIAADLYMGEKAFLKFVKGFTIYDGLMDVVWMEGCVIIDILSKRIYFFAWEFPVETSVSEYYLSKIVDKWKGWEVQKLVNRMYDGEKILGIDYISVQELDVPEKVAIEDITNDEEDSWKESLVIIKEQDQLFVTSCTLTIADIITFGPAAISLLQQKKQIAFPQEEDGIAQSCIIIDTANKHLYISESVFGILENAFPNWNEYTFTMGDYGYIGILRLAGIDTAHLRMANERVLEVFQNIVEDIAPYDPGEIAQSIIKAHPDAQFHHNFFDTAHPKASIISRITNFFRKKQR